MDSVKEKLNSLTFFNIPDKGEDGVEHLVDVCHPVHVVGRGLPGVHDQVRPESHNDKLVSALEGRQSVADLLDIPSLNKVEVLSLRETNLGVEPLDVGVTEDQVLSSLKLRGHS